MSFSPDVAEKAMLACGRHCCLCHKFCGFKIETHHIKLKRDGGENSFENCIPLCLDCHAEVGIDNSKHPQGRKFTESELKAHRDRWYQRIETGGLIFHEEKHLEVDRVVFAQIREILRSDEVILFLREFDFGGTFQISELRPLTEYRLLTENPEAEFLNIQLEGMWVELRNAIVCFLNCSAGVIFLDPNEKDRDEWGIPRQWEFDRNTGVDKAKLIQNNLNDLADKIVNAYDDLIRQGRRILSVP